MYVFDNVLDMFGVNQNDGVNLGKYWYFVVFKIH